MHEFVGRQSALLLKGSYLAARKMIYLLILRLVKEIKKSRRAGSREQTFPSSPGILNSKDQGRDFPPGKQKSTAQAATQQVRIWASIFIQTAFPSAVKEGQWHSGSNTEIPHFSLHRPTYVSQGASENGQFSVTPIPSLISKGQISKGIYKPNLGRCVSKVHWEPTCLNSYVNIVLKSLTAENMQNR